MLGPAEVMDELFFHALACSSSGAANRRTFGQHPEPAQSPEHPELCRRVLVEAGTLETAFTKAHRYGDLDELSSDVVL